MGLGNTTGALPVANGGTGASSVSTALQNLGIQAGTASIVVSANSYADATVYFSPSFSSTPRTVLLTLYRDDGTTSQNVSILYLTAKTYSYFTFRCIRTSTGTSTFYVNWLAIQ